EAERFNRPMPKVCDFMWVTCGGRGYSLGNGRAVGRKAVKRRWKICAVPYRTACSLCDKVERCRGRVCSCPVPSPDTCPENFLIILLFDGEAAILLATIEAFCTSLRVSRRKFHHMFNASVMALSYFITVWTVRLSCGSPAVLVQQSYSQKLILALSVMALAQYASNTVLIACALALRTGERFWHVWKHNFLYTSLTYFAGASAAGLVAKLIGSVGFLAFLAMTPIIAIVYFTYQTYLNSVETKLAQIEQAERHVEELSRHIAEQQRISQELQHSREHFRHAAFHDALTGLPNRALLLDHLRLAIETTKRHADHGFAVLFIDLDRFKNINDSLGHGIGDHLLIALARRLEGSIRP